MAKKRVYINQLLSSWTQWMHRASSATVYYCIRAMLNNLIWPRIDLDFNFATKAVTESNVANSLPIPTQWGKWTYSAVTNTSWKRWLTDIVVLSVMSYSMDGLSRLCIQRNAIVECHQGHPSHLPPKWKCVIQTKEMCCASGFRQLPTIHPTPTSAKSSRLGKTLRNVAKFLESETAIRPKCPTKSSNIWCPSVTSIRQRYGPHWKAWELFRVHLHLLWMNPWHNAFFSHFRD